MKSIIILAGLIALTQAAYQPCPLLRAYFPVPYLDALQTQALATATKNALDLAIQNSSSSGYSEITPNTTSVSISLFSSKSERPVFFEYSHSPNGTLLPTEEYPIGTLTQLWSVYSWLSQKGDQEWNLPITKFLPELHGTVDWQDVTIGMLASDLAGVIRDSRACQIDRCDKRAFLDAMSKSRPLFKPGTTPIYSNAAFQLLSFALEASTGHSYTSVTNGLLKKLNMTCSGLVTKIFNVPRSGEPASFGLYSTVADLAKFGVDILSSRSLSDGISQRWLQPRASTSNIRNSVGAPWEIYHSGGDQSIIDVYTKSGSIGNYSSYFGLAPDFDTGFAVLAYDPTGAPDLNGYVDILSDSLERIAGIAVKESSTQFDGIYSDGNSSITVKTASLGISVSQVIINGINVRDQLAKQLKTTNLDLRLYASNVEIADAKLFVPVLQDINAPADAGTPTCVTWQTVGSVGNRIEDGFIFELDDTGRANALQLPGYSIRLGKNT